mgnify:CR=1 FL=1
MLDLAPIDRTLPFAILLLPLAGFIVLALLGDRIKRDGESAGAGYLACATVLTAFGRVEPVADPRSDWFVRRLPDLADTLPG